jgi:hypothetical protein
VCFAEVSGLFANFVWYLLVGLWEGDPGVSKLRSVAVCFIYRVVIIFIRF